MTDQQNNNTVMDQNEFMKRMKAIASDLWGVSLSGGEMPSSSSAPKQEPEPLKQGPQGPDIRSLWKTADETVDWTDALAHSTPTDGLTPPKTWNFYHKHAEKVLSGNLDAYTEILQKANPLGELTEFAENITMQAQSPDRLESCFVCAAAISRSNRASTCLASSAGLRSRYSSTVFKSSGRWLLHSRIRGPL